MNLNAGDCNNVDKILGVDFRIMKEYFKPGGGMIRKGDAYYTFVSCKKRKND